VTLFSQKCRHSNDGVTGEALIETFRRTTKKPSRVCWDVVAVDQPENAVGIAQAAINAAVFLDA
jgi:hypothetical protein